MDNSLPHIIIFGNIASGKSTVSKSLNEKLDAIRYYSIDDLRLERYSKEDEKHFFIEDFVNAEMLRGIESCVHFRIPIIYETVTTSRLYRKVRYELIKSGRPIRRYLIDTPLEECYRRHQERMANGHQVIAPPFVDQTKIKEGMRKIHHELKGVEAERIDGTLAAEEIVEFILTKTKT